MDKWMGGQAGQMGSTEDDYGIKEWVNESQKEWMDGLMDGWRGGWMGGGQMDEWVDDQVDGWMGNSARAW